MIDEESPAIFGGCVQPLPFCAAACSYCLVVCANGSVQNGCMQLSKNSSVAHIGLIDSSHCKQLCMQLADITQSIGSALLPTGSTAHIWWEIFTLYMYWRKYWCKSAAVSYDSPVPTRSVAARLPTRTKGICTPVCWLAPECSV
jgi:hypothetical protein